MKKYFRNIYSAMRGVLEILFLKQVYFVLSRNNWGSPTLEENNELMVSMEEISVVRCGIIDKDYKVNFSVRKTLADKLVHIAECLPEGIHLVIIEGYRSLEKQQYGWDQKCRALREKYPKVSDAEIENMARLVTAKPSRYANHITGGAIDVTLCNRDGELLDMGTPYPTHLGDMEFRDHFPMFAIGLTREQKENRTLLRQAMMREGFVFYPGEWWHYCYGDRMWAVYTKRTEYFYGPIEPEE